MKLSIKQNDPKHFIARVLYYLRSVASIIIIFLLSLFISGHWMIPFVFFCFTSFFLARAVSWAKYNIISLELHEGYIYLEYLEYNFKKRQKLKLEDTVIKIDNAFAKGVVRKMIVKSNNFNLIQYESKFWDKDNMNFVINSIS